MMSVSDQPLIAIVTTPDHDIAGVIATALVEKRIAACVNILPEIRSIYRWEKEVHDDGEVMMIIKTRTDLFDPDLIACVKELHPYQVPEIIAVKIEMGESTYLKWLLTEAGKDRP
jgi:periplasmic divalent cation tolerance protein